MSSYYYETIPIKREYTHIGQFKKLWSTPIAEFVCTLSNINNIRDTIKKIAYQKKNNADKSIETNVSSKIKYNIFESNFSFLNLEKQTSLSEADSKNLCEIIDWFKICISDYYHVFFKKEKALSEIRIKESWIHITNNNGYHGPHIHQNCSICGNFYVDIGESNIKNMNGINCFFSPISTDLSIDGYDYYSTADTIIPQDFKLTLFPPNILHNATPYSGKTDRIVLAFNALYGSANIEHIA
jgi:hypothetical protein